MTTFNDIYADAEQQQGHTYLNTVAGISFYEHGTYGDECPMLFKHNGTFYYSDYYDMPSFHEAEDMKNIIKQCVLSVRIGRKVEGI